MIIIAIIWLVFTVVCLVLPPMSNTLIICVVFTLLQPGVLGLSVHTCSKALLIAELYRTYLRLIVPNVCCMLHFLPMLVFVLVIFSDPAVTIAVILVFLVVVVLSLIVINVALKEIGCVDSRLVREYGLCLRSCVFCLMN